MKDGKLYLLAEFLVKPEALEETTEIGYSAASLRSALDPPAGWSTHPNKRTSLAT